MPGNSSSGKYSTDNYYSSSSSSSSSSSKAKTTTKSSHNSQKEPVEQLFYSYADKKSGIIGPEGIESFCSDLKVNFSDVRILMMAWKMKANKQGYFTLKEWKRGLKAMGGANTLPKIKHSLSGLFDEFKDPAKFEDFYTFAFKYCLTEERQKGVDTESVCTLLDLIMEVQFGRQLEDLVKFLKEQEDYKVITLDQWGGFYRFFKEISFPDFGNYDPAFGWPSILDDFVDWMKSKNG